MKRHCDSGRCSGVAKTGLVTMLVGVVVLSLSPLAWIVATVPQMAPDTWIKMTALFVGLLWFGVSAGLVLIGWPFFVSRKARAVWMAVALLTGFAVSYYPGIQQLLSGDAKAVGMVAEVTLSTATDRFRVDHQTGKVSKQRSRKYDVIRLETSSGEKTDLELIRSDAERAIAMADTIGKPNEIEVTYLRYLKRLLEVEDANP